MRNLRYSWTRKTRTTRGPKNLFELSGFWVTGVFINLIKSYGTKETVIRFSSYRVSSYPGSYAIKYSAWFLLSEVESLPSAKRTRRSKSSTIPLSCNGSPTHILRWIIDYIVLHTTLWVSYHKLHRVGKIKDRNGNQSQDIIVKFKSHSARYKVYKGLKKKGKEH